MKLYTSFKSLILEAANMDSIIKSIKDKQIVTINYDGDEPGGKGLRTIEPVCLGYTKKGNPVLRAWDYEGASHKGYTGEKPLPSWRFFRLDRIISFIPTRDNFTEPKPGYNPRGDKSMTRVIINAKFGNE
jgi:predicted DNA-binding transcriptional regulator YafY